MSVVQSEMRWFQLKFKQAVRSRRNQARRWLRSHPRVATVLDRLGCLHVNREAVARGVAVGLFVGLTPTVGVQVFLMVFICWSFRANFLAAFAASWICNPLTVGPLYFAYHSIGEAFLGRYAAPFAHFPGLSAELLEDVLFMFSGSLFMAVPAAFAGYLLTAWIMRQKSVDARLRTGSRLTPSASPPLL